ncbi:MAG: ribonuclease H-like domain-containing protein [Alphaproteobacteria bacterium]|nr:ribonuclease H-like domain-containing protein [Alphaproteobacteria bacterium]
MSITLHRNDLPEGLDLGDSIAIDTETMGLLPERDRLCVIQLSSGDGTAHLVQFDKDIYDAPNIKKLVENPDVLKIFHFARFDVAIIKKYLGVQCNNVYCTKIASKFARTYTDKHGLRYLCRDILGVDLSKQQQSSDWGSKDLSSEQLSYAASDVLYLHRLMDQLNTMLEREDRKEIAQRCFDFITVRADLDLLGWQDDIFEH